MWLGSWWKILCGYLECAHYLHSRFLISAQQLSLSPNQLFTSAMQDICFHEPLRIAQNSRCFVLYVLWEKIETIQLSYFYKKKNFLLPWTQELSVWPQGSKYSEQEGRQFVALCTHQDLKLQEIKFDKAWWDLVSDPLHQRDFVTNSICRRLLNTRLVSHLETLFRPSGEFKICLEAESNSILVFFFAALGTQLQ